MPKSLSRIQVVILLTLMCVFTQSMAHGAADWKWIRGQGWSRGGGTPKSTPNAQLRYAYSLDQKKSYQEAARQYFLMIQTYPDSTEASIALQRLAGCLFSMENYYQSFQALEQVLKTYPKSLQVEKLVEIEYRIGVKLKKGAAVSLFTDDKKDAKKQSSLAAIEVFETALKHDAYGSYAEKVLLALGDCYRDLGDGETGLKYYTRLTTEYPKSKYYDIAELGQMECRVLLGRARTSEVSRKLDEVKQRQKLARESGEVAKPDEQIEEVFDTAETRLKSLNDTEVKKLYESARYYEKRGSRRSITAAKWSYEQLIKRYPKSRWAKLAQKRLAKLRIPKKKVIDLAKIKIPFMSKKPKVVVATQRGKDQVFNEAVVTPTSSDSRPDPKAIASQGTAPSAPPIAHSTSVTPLGKPDVAPRKVVTSRAKRDNPFARNTMPMDGPGKTSKSSIASAEQPKQPLPVAKAVTSDVKSTADITPTFVETPKPRPDAITKQPKSQDENAPTHGWDVDLKTDRGDAKAVPISRRKIVAKPVYDDAEKNDTRVSADSTKAASDWSFSPDFD